MRGGISSSCATNDADFTNRLLDEPFETWSDQVRLVVTPFIYVFDRDGRLARSSRATRRITMRTSSRWSKTS